MRFLTTSTSGGMGPSEVSINSPSCHLPFNSRGVSGEAASKSASASSIHIGIQVVSLLAASRDILFDQRVKFLVREGRRVRWFICQSPLAFDR